MPYRLVIMGLACWCALQECGVTEVVQDESDALLGRIGLMEDMRMEWDQTEVLRALLSEAPSSLVGMDEVCVCGLKPYKHLYHNSLMLYVFVRRYLYVHGPKFATYNNPSFAIIIIAMDRHCCEYQLGQHFI